MNKLNSRFRNWSHLSKELPKSKTLKSELLDAAKRFGISETEWDELKKSHFKSTCCGASMEYDKEQESQEKKI